MENMGILSIIYGNFIIPTDELIFFKMVIAPSR
jgi:hypothetical protein